MKLFLIQIPAQADLLDLKVLQTLRQTIVVICSQKLMSSSVKKYTHPNIDYYDTDTLSFDQLTKIIYAAHQIDKNIAYLCPDGKNHGNAGNRCDGEKMMDLLQSKKIPYQIMPFEQPHYRASA